MLRVYTIGHGDRSADELMDLLCRHGVTHVVDVRHDSDSAGTGPFEPANIRNELLARGIIYASMSDSLGMQKPESDSPNLLDEELRIGLQQLMQVVMSDPDRVVCLLGKEKEPERCHRCTVLGEALARVRVDVEHIEDDEVVQHKYVMQRSPESTLF